MGKFNQCYFHLPANPKGAIKELYQGSDYIQLLATLQDWIPIALCDELGYFSDFTDREQFILFCNDILELIGVLYKEDLFEDRSAIALCRSFVATYPLVNIRIELIKLLNAVAGYEGEIELKREGIGQQYLYLLTVAEIPHYIAYGR